MLALIYCFVLRASAVASSDVAPARLAPANLEHTLRSRQLQLEIARDRQLLHPYQFAPSSASTPHLPTATAAPQPDALLLPHSLHLRCFTLTFQQLRLLFSLMCVSFTALLQIMLDLSDPFSGTYSSDQPPLESAAARQPEACRSADPCRFPASPPRQLISAPRRSTWLRCACAARSSSRTRPSHSTMRSSARRSGPPCRGEPHMSMRFGYSRHSDAHFVFQCLCAGVSRWPIQLFFVRRSLVTTVGDTRLHVSDSETYAQHMLHRTVNRV